MARALLAASAASQLNVYQALFAQCLDCLTDRRSAHAKLIRELALRWQLIGNLQIAAEDALSNLLDDLFIEPFCLNFPVHRFDRVRKEKDAFHNCERRPPPLANNRGKHRHLPEHLSCRLCQQIAQSNPLQRLTRYDVHTIIPLAAILSIDRIFGF